MKHLESKDYQKVNESFRRRLVYHVGKEYGFFVELNYVGSRDGSLTHFWLILQMLFIPFINKLNMRAKIQNLYHNCK